LGGRNADGGLETKPRLSGKQLVGKLAALRLLNNRGYG